MSRAAGPDDWALITGASGGIGAALAAEAARSGYGLVLSARRGEALQAVAARLARACNVPTLVIAADLSQPGEAERLWQEACAGRRIAVLVNNAGLGHFGGFAEAGGWPREAQSLAVNITAPSVLMKAATVAMAARGGGRILNVASTAAFQPAPHLAVYAATKAYLLSLSEAVAEEMSGTGVTVTALCPGATATGFFAAGGLDPAGGEVLLTRAGMSDPATVAAAGWGAMMAGRRICVPGFANKVQVQANRIAPRRLVTLVGALLLKRRK